MRQSMSGFSLSKVWKKGYSKIHPKYRAHAPKAAWGVVLLVLVLFFFGSSGEMRYVQPDFTDTTFSITRWDGMHLVFNAKVAKTDKEQAFGLMFVRSMPEDAGMIFPYDYPKEVVFWMKDTLIPLDIIFVGRNGNISRIVANAKPHDKTPIYSEEPVIAVLEINGGLADRLQIQAGNKVESSAIHRPE